MTDFEEYIENPCGCGGDDDYNVGDEDLYDDVSKGLSRQVSGNHYDMPIQHSEFVHANNIPYIEANIMKYLIRHRNKNGLDDLRKAYHYIEILAELEYGEDL